MSYSTDVPAHRACTSCREQKVRCTPDDTLPDVCRRCARSGRPCLYNPVQKRKQRKRTDTRVAELEYEMRTMRRALQQKEDATRSPTTVQGRADYPAQAPGLYRSPRPSVSATGRHPAESDSTEAEGTRPRPRDFTNNPAYDEADIVDRGIITVETAGQLVETYRNEQFPQYPVVHISETADELRHTKPILFLAVVAAAAGMVDAELSSQLDKEVLKTYATRSMMRSEKSLELIQALLVSALWFHPATKFGQLKYYEYICMAATMALDIGINSSGHTPRSRLGRDRSSADTSSRSQGSSSFSTDLECRRTFLACYITSSGMSLGLRRQNLLRVSNYIRESADYIERLDESLPTDAALAAWVRAIMMLEEISIAFGYDDPESSVSIAELSTQLMMKDFEKRISAWHASVQQAGAFTGSLVIIYYTMRLYTYEVALHVDHAIDDFRAPYQMSKIQPQVNANEVPSRVLAEAVAKCVDSVHGLVDAFISIDPASLRAVPVVAYVRVSFAFFVLAKLSLSAANPKSRIGQVLDRNTLKVETYFDRAILHVRTVIGSRPLRVPGIFLSMLFKLRQWSLNPGIIGQEDVTSHSGAVMVRFPAGPEAYEDISHVDTAGHGAARPQSSTTSVNTERLSQYISSTGQSPQIATNDSQSKVFHATGYAIGGDLPDMHDSMQDNPDSPSDSFAIAAAAASGSVPAAHGEATGAGRAASLMPGANLWTSELTNLDADLLQMYEELNASSEGGLTGLDDWAHMPADFATMRAQMGLAGSEPLYPFSSPFGS